MIRSVRGLMVVLLLLVAPREVGAEWQFKPFLGVTFAPFTTYVDSDLAAGSVDDAGSVHSALGGSVLLLGEVFGIEADFSRVSGFFEKSGAPDLVLSSNVSTLTGNVVAAMPRRLSRYTLRPYAVAGFGMISVRIQGAATLNPLAVKDRVGAMNFGGGATGFFNERVGVGWELRHFRAVGADPGGILLENGQLSFWRANMALVLRY